MIEDLEIVRNGLVTLMATQSKPIAISVKQFHKTIDETIVDLGGEKSPIDMDALFEECFSLPTPPKSRTINENFPIPFIEQ